MKCFVSRNRKNSGHVFAPGIEGRCWDGHDGCHAPRILRRRGKQANRQRYEHSGRDDQLFYAVPYDKLVAAVCPEAKLRKLVKNMVYVGVVANLLTIDMAEVEKAIRKQFAKKAKAANLNLAAAQAGFDYAKTSLQKRGTFYIERMNKTAGKIIIDGNSAAALGCMFADVRSSPGIRLHLPRRWSRR